MKAIEALQNHLASHEQLKSKTPHPLILERVDKGVTMPNSVKTELQGELKIPVTDQEEKEFEMAGRDEE